MPNGLPPRTVVYQQTQHWIRAQCFETMVQDLRMLLREFSGRKAQPTAMILESRTLQSTSEFGARAMLKLTSEKQELTESTASCYSYCLPLYPLVPTPSNNIC